MEKRVGFPLDQKDTIVLDREIEVFGRVIRKGAVLKIEGWREINEESYVLLSKSTWEILVPLHMINHLISS
jgi:hypothetical protein